jgi:hypothetical protein
MPQHLHVLITESYGDRFRKAFEHLLVQVARGDDPATGFAHVRQILEALPMTSAEFCTAINRLANAQHYLRAGERGASSYELNLLLRGLELGGLA